MMPSENTVKKLSEYRHGLMLAHCPFPTTITIRMLQRLGVDPMDAMPKCLGMEVVGEIPGWVKP